MTAREKEKSVTYDELLTKIILVTNTHAPADFSIEIITLCLGANLAVLGNVFDKNNDTVLSDYTEKGGLTPQEIRRL